jgi:alkanesulfonate monooxygenase SsuD/methylene tetrahydromethanopterin reductase-like flavin-dependent oxidoreductase (luciferase family)
MTIPFTGVPLQELGPLVRRIDDAGYDSVWSAESTEFDGFTPLVVAAEHSTRLRLATGIVNVYTRGPALLAQTAAAVANLSNGRFVPGLGASSNVIVEQWNGIPFRRPLAKVEETVEYLREVLAGERGTGGFKLASPPEQPVPIVLAALRDRMLGLAARIADGAFTNFLPLSQAAKVIDAFAAPRKSSRAGSSRSTSGRRGAHHRETHLRRLRDGARLRRVLPLAGLRRGDRSRRRGMERG